MPLAHQRSRSPFDGASLLSVYFLLLLCIPSNYVIGVIGAAGSPSQLMGLGMLAWWAFRRLNTPYQTAGLGHPVRKALLLLAMAVLASYVAAMSRPLDGIEASAVNRGVLGFASWVGVFLVAADEIPTTARLNTLIQRLTLFGAAVASLGILQFATKRAWTEYLLIPGLVVNSEAASVVSRVGFTRPAGTALHPIEFGVAVAILLPLALHLSVVNARKPFVIRWFPIATIGLAAPLSISRSSILCVVVAVTFALPALATGVRRTVSALGIVMLVVVYVAIPGMIGALIGLFTTISDDNSAESRTDSYSLALQFIEQAPVFGRGFFTFLPAYRILDNEYLLFLIEAGIAGLLALLLFFGTAIVVALSTHRRLSDAYARQLAQLLGASVAAGAMGFAFFDAFGFPIVPALTFAVAGLISTQRRLAIVGALPGRNIEAASPSRAAPLPRGKSRARDV